MGRICHITYSVARVHTWLKKYQTERWSNNRNIGGNVQGVCVFFMQKAAFLWGNLKLNSS